MKTRFKTALIFINSVSNRTLLIESNRRPVKPLVSRFNNRPK